jgi:hypothetical protein
MVRLWDGSIHGARGAMAARISQVASFLHVHIQMVHEEG